MEKGLHGSVAVVVVYGSEGAIDGEKVAVWAAVAVSSYDMRRHRSSGSGTKVIPLTTLEGAKEIDSGSAKKLVGFLFSVNFPKIRGAFISKGTTTVGSRRSMPCHM